MKRGIVTHVGINARGNHYGFIRPDDGGYDVYFNHFGGHGKFSIAGITPEPSLHWTDLSTDIVMTSDFPEVGDVIHYAEQSSRTELHEGAWIWCIGSTYYQLETMIFHRAIPYGERGTWDQLESAIAELKMAIDGGHSVLVQANSDRIVVLSRLLTTRPIDPAYLAKRITDVVDLIGGFVSHQAALA